MVTLRRVFQGIVALLVMGLVANCYANGGTGFVSYEVPPYLYYGVAIAALIVPAFWAAMHLCGGMLFGIAAGGFFDGLKLGFTLGLGMALGKCWPYALAVGAGVYLGQGPLFYAVGFVILGALLFALDRMMHYFWKSTRDGHDQG